MKASELSDPYRSCPEYGRIRDGIDHLVELRNAVEQSPINHLESRFSVVTLIFLIQHNLFADVPIEMVADELNDFAGVFFAQNSQVAEDEISLSFPNLTTPPPSNDFRRVEATVVAAFGNEFVTLMEHVLAPKIAL